MKKLSDTIKNNIPLTVLVIILTSLVVIVCSSIPKEHIEVYEGIEFKLNSDDFIEEALIFDGKFIDPLIGHRKFNGRIIYGTNIYECHLVFKNNSDYIFMLDHHEKEDRIPTRIYMTDDFEKLVLIISDKKENATTWNNYDGTVFVSKTRNIKDAHKILESFEIKLKQ